MHMPDPVETILARLMPPALSVSGQREIEAMLDELAGPAVAKIPKPHRFHFPLIAGGIAAAFAAAAVIFPLAHPLSPSGEAGITSPDIVLVSESDRVESMSDEGWRDSPDGSTMRAMRLNVIEENSLLDEETGIVIQVSEPREELLLMPISTF
ncbi:MAG: hypothetical protein Q8Q59_13180 [Luteolibacter sp.]|jgi:hypothetical protein|nr:hypothetical protein [Luteolibacter sp.]